MGKNYNDDELKREVTEVFGVTFSKEQIPVTKDGKPIYSPELVVLPNGTVSKQAVVKLNDGTTVRFPQQEKAANASIIIDKNSKTVRFTGVQGLNVKDTPEDDKYLFRNCSGTVNAKRETHYAFGVVSGAGISYREAKRTFSKDKDEIWVYNSNMTIHSTPGYDIVYPRR